MPALSPLIETAFNNWMKVSTWHTWHPLDEARFHEFVWTCVRRSRNGGPDEQQIKDLILSEWTGRLAPEFLDDAANQASSLYQSLYDFGKAQRNSLLVCR
jgi:hypothetical protein